MLIAAHAVDNRTKDGEPIAMMVEAASRVLERHGGSMAKVVESVRVVKGIWPYADPGHLVAAHLGLGEVQTALTRIGGNATYDLVNQTASEIASGQLSAALICGAESMRTRRADKAAGKRSTYLHERDGATPDIVTGAEVTLTDSKDDAAGVSIPVNFYALVESAIRHGRGQTPDDHLIWISELWESASKVAQRNPDAWLDDVLTAEDIATASPTNRMVASPYTKLLTSNINVDQGAAMLLCSYEVAHAHGIADHDLVFVLGGSSAHDHIQIRRRDRLDRSPAFSAIAQSCLDEAGLSIDSIEHLDLYSCFPAAVQLAQAALDLDEGRQFTITGGLTFAGGPFNGYCTQALAKATELLAGKSETAFLYGNGGFFSKHSVLVVSGATPRRPFTYTQPQLAVDQAPARVVADNSADGLRGQIEAHTVVFDRHGAPANAILSVLDESHRRHWAVTTLPQDLKRLHNSDLVGQMVTLRQPVMSETPPTAVLTSY